MGEKIACPVPSTKPVQLANELKKIWSSQHSEDVRENFNISRFPYLPYLQCAMVCLPISLMFRSGMVTSLNAQPHLVVYAILMFSMAVMVVSIYLRWRPSPCYLVDFCCTNGGEDSKVGVESYEYFVRTWKSVMVESCLFQMKVLLRSGIGEEASAPTTLIEKGEETNNEDARQETQKLISLAARLLLRKTGVDPKEIDIVVLNSSLFYPSPSLTAFLVNRLKMRSNVKSFNLAGMGCSAGLISVDLAKDLLRVHRNSYALVVSTENITQNMYYGSDRSMMVSNCLFRCGASALLLSNKAKEKSRAKLQLMHCLRVHRGADQNSFECVTQKEDEEGKRGVSLQITLMDVAGQALRENITKLAPRILPLSELLKVVVNIVRRKVLNKAIKPYDPNFKKTISHFCIHPGGRAVIDSIGKGLKLSQYDVEPGRMALNRFGNTSSSGIWYAMAYLEAKNRLKKGEKVWQIALGSGFKCNSAVWKVMRDIEPWEGEGCNPWLDCVHRFPDDARPMNIKYSAEALLRLVISEEKMKPEDAEAWVNEHLSRLRESEARYKLRIA